MTLSLSNPLHPILTALEGHSVVLSKARHQYLVKEARRHHFESRLIQGATGKSVAEKTINARALAEWEAFQVELADIESRYQFELLKNELLNREYFAQLASLKIDAGLIGKQE